jgi:hypothetical protein
MMTTHFYEVLPARVQPGGDQEVQLTNGELRWPGRSKPSTAGSGIGATWRCRPEGTQ